jgi:hypothetical protein
MVQMFSLVPPFPFLAHGDVTDGAFNGTGEPQSYPSDLGELNPLVGSIDGYLLGIRKPHPWVIAIALELGVSASFIKELLIRCIQTLQQLLLGVQRTLR